MIVKDRDHAVGHAEPAPKSGADFLIHADLAEHGMPGRWEQLWAQSVDRDRKFKICCVPFFTYGLALFDVVATRGTEAPDLVVKAVFRRSGHLVLRLVVPDPDSVSSVHPVLHEALVHSGLYHEWHTSGYVAVDLPARGADRELLRALDQQLASGELLAELA